MNQDEALQILKDAFGKIDFQKVRAAYVCLAGKGALNTARQKRFLDAVGTIQQIVNSLSQIPQVRAR
jgi:hypothetical protein